MSQTTQWSHRRKWRQDRSGEDLNSTILDPQVTAFLATQPGVSGQPKGYLNWVLFDEQFKFVSSSSGSEAVDASGVFKTFNKANMPVHKNGYLYIYVSNETSCDVFFDNLQVTHVRGRLLEESHYYPFGLTMAGISSKALSFGGPENKRKYQQYEFNSSFDLNLYESFYRTHDPQIGRFLQIDPKPDYSVSLYAAMNNNPIKFSDFLGDSSIIDKNGYVLHYDPKDKDLRVFMQDGKKRNMLENLVGRLKLVNGLRIY